MWVCAAFMPFNAFLALALRCKLVWDNKKLDEKYGKRKDIKGEVEGGEENEGLRYRYIL
jgi:hypothetical protein